MAGTIKLLAVADGFGDSWASPAWYPDYFKWPRILGLMTRGVEVIDLCRYGAGNEYLTWCVRQNYLNCDMVLVQWAQPVRLDLVLAHDSIAKNAWLEQIQHDPVYHDNVIHMDQDQWWLSSASKSSNVQEYHGKIISRRQHEIRSLLWIEYTHALLDTKPHGFMLTPDSAYLSTSRTSPDIWIWHEPWKGMDDWRHHSVYRDLDLGITQPIPLIHFDFIMRFIMPKFDLPWRSTREINAVETMLLRKYNECKDKQPR